MPNCGWNSLEFNFRQLRQSLEREEKEKFVVMSLRTPYIVHMTSHKAISRPRSAVTAKKCSKTCDPCVELFSYCFLKLSLPSLSMSLNFLYIDWRQAFSKLAEAGNCRRPYHSVFTDWFIFRYIWEHFFPRKWKFRSVCWRIQSVSKEIEKQF